MRYLLICLLLLSAGCAPAIATPAALESADARAVREWFRNKYGDGEPLEIVKVHKAGTAKDFLVGVPDHFEQCEDPGRCVPVTVKVRGIGDLMEKTWLFVIENGKVTEKYGWYKRK